MVNNLLYLLIVMLHQSLGCSLCKAYNFVFAIYAYQLRVYNIIDKMLEIVNLNALSALIKNDDKLKIGDSVD